MMNLRGVTLIEILIGAAIVVILASLVITEFSRFRENNQLNSAAEIGLSLLQEARSKTLSSQDASQYGVHFEQSRVVLFKGASYSATDPDNSEVLLSSNTEISIIALNGGGSDVIFERLTGETNQYGAVTFRLISNTSKTKVVNIILTGIAGTP